MKMSYILFRLWVWIRWPATLLALFYVALVIWRVFVLTEQDKTKAAVAHIHSTKLTREEVFANLPPAPDAEINNSTVVGIDSNNNGIRDDVERAIYFADKESAGVAGALMQYAKTEQMFLTDVYNAETWRAVAEENSRAGLCLASTYPRTNLKKFGEVIEGRINEIQNLTFNTEERKKMEKEVYRFITSFGTTPGPVCDVEIGSLPD